MKNLKYASLALLPLLLIICGCSNPADNVAEAAVGDAKVVGSVTAGELLVYTVTPRSKIEFVGSKVTGKHDGGFTGFTGSFHTVNGELKAQGSKIEIDTDSMWTDDARLTTKLKTAEYFDTTAFPKSTFEATEIKQLGTAYRVVGNFSLHGVTKSISFPADIRIKDGTLTLKAEFFIKRFDFGILATGMKNDLIRDEVIIRLDIVASS